jgi:hypothetical protein
MKAPTTRPGRRTWCGGTEGASSAAPAAAGGTTGAPMGGTASTRGTGPGIEMPGRKAPPTGTAASLGALGPRERGRRPGRSPAEAELRVLLATSDVEAAESRWRGRWLASCASEAGDSDSELVSLWLFKFDLRLRLPPVPVGGEACKKVLRCRCGGIVGWYCGCTVEWTPGSI